MPSTITTPVADWNAQVAERIIAAYATMGLANEPEEGETTEKDLARVRLSLLDALGSAKVRKPEDKDAKAISKGALAQRIFADIPGAKPGEYAELDPLDQEVWDKLTSQVWGFTNPYGGVTSGLQAMVGERYKGFVMCHGQITLPSNDAAVAVYVTDNEQLLFEDFVEKLKQDVVKAQSRHGRQVTMVASRRPELRSKLLKELQSSSKSASAAAIAYFELNAPSADAE